jgi:hypothetical protein
MAMVIMSSMSVNAPAASGRLGGQSVRGGVRGSLRAQGECGRQSGSDDCRLWCEQPVNRCQRSRTRYLGDVQQSDPELRKHAALAIPGRHGQQQGVRDRSVERPDLSVRGHGLGGVVGDGGKASAAQIGTTSSAYISTYDNRIRRVDGSSLIMTTIAGSGENSATSSALNGDGDAATSASFQRLWQLFGDTSQALVVSGVKNLSAMFVFAGDASSNVEGSTTTSTDTNEPVFGATSCA